VQHFHEKLQEEYGIRLSYTSVKLAVQGAGLVAKQTRRGTHRRGRPRRPLPAMLLHIDASKHAWLGDGRHYDLITILDDATSEIYYAQLVDEESTRTLMPAVLEVIETEGMLCALYSGPSEPFLHDAQGGGKVYPNQLAQLGRALQELGIKIIRHIRRRLGRMERSYRSWQSRLQQELRIRKIQTMAEANRFLQEQSTPFPFPPGGSRGRGKVPPTPRHASCQPTTLGTPRVAAPPQDGLAPLCIPLEDLRRGVLYVVNRTSHLLIEPDRLACYQHTYDNDCLTQEDRKVAITAVERATSIRVVPNDRVNVSAGRKTGTRCPY
jgi:hypothetical protein